MIRALVVDDNEERRALLVTLLRENIDGLVSEVIEADAVLPAKRVMRDKLVDVFVVDLALPNRTGEKILGDGGLRLIHALQEEDSDLQVPTHIVAITAHEHLFVSLEHELRGAGIVLLRYEVNSEMWINSFRTQIQRFSAAVRSKEAASRTHDKDVAIVCALSDPELTSVRSLPWSWRSLRLGLDSTRYFEGDIPRATESWSVVAAAAPRMGMPASAALAAKLLAKFRPRYLCMVGICAGREGKVEFGDVIVADPSWDSGSGKWIVDQGKQLFRQAQHQLPLKNDVREAARSLAEDRGLLDEIRAGWSETRPNHELNVRLGPFASGSAVVADGITLEAIANERQRDVVGLDMEAYGIFSAAEAFNDPPATPFVMKSVVDFADGSKDDRFRRYAAYTCASTFRYLLERFL